ncbi:MAG: putative LPS assembly protein LptD, partial [Bacteroidota bacterium]
MKFSVKGKQRVGHLRYGFILFILTLSTLTAQAQNVSSDSLDVLLSDTTNLADTLIEADTAKFSGSLTPDAPKSDISTTINYQANDSIDFDVVNQILFLYGDAKIDYGSIKLDAAYIEYSWGDNLLTAYGVPDSTGRVQGKPLFKDGQESFETDSIRYNFISRKALISGVVTEQGEGYVQAERVKRLANGNAAMGNVAYTTCNLKEPHFHIEANKIMMIPGDKFISGPFHLEVANIPTPLGFLFGMFPVQKENEAGSGVIIPKYGEENRRGFFLRGGGYYWAISEYLDARLTGDIYSKGSYALTLESRYLNRYKYSGNLSVQYSNQRLGFEVEDTVRNQDIWVRWSHTPKTQGKHRLSANVSAGTSGFNQINPTQNFGNTLRQEFNSSVSYSTTFFENRFNFSTNFRMNQNVTTRKADILLPEVALGMNRIYPFKKAGSAGKTWYEKINFSWRFNATNRLSNVLPFEAADGTDSIAAFSSESIPVIIRNSNNGGRHSVPISTSFNLFKYITVSPSVNINEYWYLKELNWRYDTAEGALVADTVNGFSRALEYTASAGFTTRLYGTFQTQGKIREWTGVQAIRHVLIPTVSLNYRPNFADESFGIYQEIEVPDQVNTELRSRYQGFVFGSPGSGQNGVISFSLNNNI